MISISSVNSTDFVTALAKAADAASASTKPGDSDKRADDEPGEITDLVGSRRMQREQLESVLWADL